MQTLPFLPKQYLYEVIPEGHIKKQFQVVKRLYHQPDLDAIYYAGDPAREGIYIQMLVRQQAGIKPGVMERVVWIESQTPEEIRRGLREAKTLDVYQNMADSGYMRAIEDYATGINLSRAITIKYGKLITAASGKKGVISVGRVMSCVLGMVVEKEKEVLQFNKTTYYGVDLPIGSVKATWKAVDGSRYQDSPLLYKEDGFLKKEDAQIMIAQFNGTQGVIEEKKETRKKKSAPLLFNLAELQSECTKRFKISPTKTLEVAQSLYEKQLTTYPRTDARVLSSAIAKVILENLKGIADKYPNEALPILQNQWYQNLGRYVNDEKVSDHYAIIPTGKTTGIEKLSSLEAAIFDLIVRRFLSIFYPPAEFLQVEIVIKADHEPFFLSATHLDKAGYLFVAGSKEKEDHYGEISALQKGSVLPMNGLQVTEKETKPPKRYTSGSLILAMENAGKLIEDEELREQIKGSGIGTSATRAETIKKLVSLEYIQLDKKTQICTPTDLGWMVYYILQENIPAILNPTMTASWEKGLSQIVSGKISRGQYQKILDAYITNEVDKIKANDFTAKLQKEIEPHASIKKIREPKEMNVTCPYCGGPIIADAYGRYRCKNYGKKEGQCTLFIGIIAKRMLSEAEVITLLTTGKVGPLAGFISKKGKPFPATLALQDGKVSFLDEKMDTNFPCPHCGHMLQRGQYKMICPECGFSFSHNIGDKELPDEQIIKLLTNGRSDKIFGMKSRRGKIFSGILELDKETGKISFAK